MSDEKQRRPSRATLRKTLKLAKALAEATKKPHAKEPSERMAALVHELTVATFNEAGTPGTGQAENAAREALLDAIAALEANRDRLRAVVDAVEAVRLKWDADLVNEDDTDGLDTDAILRTIGSDLRGALITAAARALGMET
jgi:hypothetical protein